MLQVSVGFLKLSLQRVRLVLQSPASPYSVSLYVNNPTVSPASLAGDFLEAAWPGYEKQLLDRWSLSYLLANYVAAIDNQPVYFLVGGQAPPVPVWVTGYFVWNTLQQLGWAEPFARPIQVWAPFQRVALVLRLTMENQQ